MAIFDYDTWLEGITNKYLDERYADEEEEELDKETLFDMWYQAKKEER